MQFIVTIFKFAAWSFRIFSAALTSLARLSLLRAFSCHEFVQKKCKIPNKLTRQCCESDLNNLNTDFCNTDPDPIYLLGLKTCKKKKCNFLFKHFVSLTAIFAWNWNVHLKNFLHQCLWPSFNFRMTIYCTTNDRIRIWYFTLPYKTSHFCQLISTLLERSRPCSSSESDSDDDDDSSTGSGVQRASSSTFLFTGGALLSMSLRSAQPDIAAGMANARVLTEKCQLALWTSEDFLYHKFFADFSRRM